MALFEKVQRLKSEYHQELIQFYEQGPFPIEVRNLFAQHIEDTLCGDRPLDADDAAHTLEIRDFVGRTLGLLEERLAKGEAFPFFVKHKLDSALHQLKEQHATDSAPIFRRMQECLKFEIDLVRRSESGVQMEQDLLMDNLAYMSKRVEGTNQLLKRMMAEQDGLDLHLQDKQSLQDRLDSVQGMVQTEQTKSFEQTLKDGITQKISAIERNLQSLMRLRNEFWEAMRTNTKSISELQAQIFQEKLFVWKFQQQKAANGFAAVNPVSLDKVQIYLENLAELLWKSRQQVQEMERLRLRNAVFNDVECDVLLEDLVTLITNLLNAAFLVEEQPPQVMKKGNKFPTAPKVTLLIGNLHIHMSSPFPQVTTCIIREDQARTLSTSEKLVTAMSVINDKVNLEVNGSTRRLSAKFATLQLREIKRAERRGSGNNSSESVMEEKLCFLFESWLHVGDLKLRVRTLSMPVVVTSHGSQDATAVATILWDNAFGLMGRIPFQVPNRVPWVDVAQLMSAKFLSVTGRPLSEDNLRCLRQKAFRGNSHSEHITWAEFCKDSLPERNFSFWQWVYAALKNIERKETHLKDLWIAGLLVGFIDRDVSSSMLSYREPGTFMLRFSDSKPGSISISVVNEDRSVFCIAPMDENELKQKRLANCIRDLDKLKFLFPDIPKDQAFSSFYSNVETSTGKGYVPLVPSLPDGNSGGRRVSGGTLPSFFMSPSSLHSPGGVQSPMGASSPMYAGSFSSPTSPMGNTSPMGSNMSPQLPLPPYNTLPSFLDHQHLTTSPMPSNSMDTSAQSDEQFVNDAMNDIADLLNEHQDLLITTPTSTNAPQGTWSDFVQL
ncbi:signal transducer and activator of transcription 5B isoform X2 [Folsomia candida]|uniref:signal transducer and activator of transcription 5B isoform X2 n=1 Tax=Folsomia candida TaxID=158441 RepID=UPI000B8F1F1F|nr:signal transducer and activator of transcription 5B isoform X2 [Folsomia candida]